MKHFADPQEVQKLMGMSETELLAQHLINNDGEIFAVCRTNTLELRTKESYFKLKKKLLDKKLDCPFDEPRELFGLSIYGFNGLTHPINAYSNNMSCIDFRKAYNKQFKLFQFVAFDYHALQQGRISLVYVYPQDKCWREPRLGGEVYYVKKKRNFKK